TLRAYGKLMQQLSVVVRLLSSLSTMAGLLILISAVFATRAERLVESVYFKTLGAGQGFVVLLNVMENAVIGLISALLAMAMAQTTAYLVCRRVMEIPYQVFAGDRLLITAGVLFLVVIVGLASAWPMLTQKPVVYLREQADG
ncbi:MAG: hypothetical protein P8X55_22215, partial [Desulfosarcinaceae bacterium]